MNESKPKVSIVMSIYNGEKYLREAVNSILAQTFQDFELIIIDDGSADGSMGVLSSFRDPRIILVKNRNNLGLPSSLNRGISIAKGVYIARMDVDDISLPDRLEKQVSFLDSHPEIGVLGGAIQYVNEQGEKGDLWICPLTPGAAKWQLFFQSPVAHPAVMMRKCILAGLDANEIYNPGETVLYAEDYDLWVRLGKIAKIMNLKDVLVCYRQHTEQVSRFYSDKQMNGRLRISHDLISGFLHVDVPLDVIRFSMVPDHDSPLAYQALKFIFRLYKDFHARNTLSFAERLEVKRDFYQRVFEIASSSHKDMRVWKYLLVACIADPQNIKRFFRKLPAGLFDDNAPDFN